MSDSSPTVNFVIPTGGNYEGYETFSGNVDGEWQRFNCGEWAWIIQTYQRLKSYSSEQLIITESTEPLSNAINIVFADDFLKLRGKNDFYFVVVVLDRLVYFPGNLSIVQNKEHNLPFRSHYISHWSQAGLIERKKEQTSEVCKIGFFGILENTVDLPRIVNELKDDDLEVIIAGPDSWNDYSNIDIAVGIRGFTNNRYIQKPATKLFNAWKAGVPFIGGIDSAYEQVGKNLKNYICVKNEAELKMSLTLLRDNKELRERLVNEGKKQFELYSNSSLINDWADLFISEIPEYRKWQKANKVKRYLNLILRRFFYNYLRFKRRFNMVLGSYS